MSNIAFAFDLHNTLMLSNDAWIEAYMELTDGAFRERVTRAVYQKRSRREIADEVGVCYDAVYSAYCRKVQPDEKMLRLLTALKSRFPVYLISAASEKRVHNDLAVWEGFRYFDEVFTKETFRKGDRLDWDRLVKEKGLDLLIYIGNDVEEDICTGPRILPLLSGDFAKKLDDLNLLIKRGEV